MGAVKREVDCVVGAGPCDNLGNRLKGEAPAAVTQGRCRGNCNCEQTGSFGGEQDEAGAHRPVAAGRVQIRTQVILTDWKYCLPVREVLLSGEILLVDQPVDKIAYD